MTTEKIIGRAVQVIGVILAAGGGFLTGIAPPDRVLTDGSPRFAIGVATLAGIVLLLIISALTEGKPTGPRRRAWLIISGGFLLIFLVSSVTYPALLDRLTFQYPEGVTEKYRFVNGTVLTSEAAEASERYERGTGVPPTKAKLVAGFSGIENIGKVWTPDSINSAERRLLIAYLVLTISLMGAIFSVVEGTLRSARRPRPAVDDGMSDSPHMPQASPRAS